MAGMPSGTVTFLFTDIEGSTARWEHQPEAMRAALARHDALLRAAILEHGGHVVKTMGDAFHAAFSRAPDAVAAAVDAQRRLQAEPWGEIGRLRVRMALHTGAAEERDGDYYGPPLNRAARLLSDRPRRAGAAVRGDGGPRPRRPARRRRAARPGGASPQGPDPARARLPGRGARTCPPTSRRWSRSTRARTTCRLHPTPLLGREQRRCRPCARCCCATASDW